MLLHMAEFHSFYSSLILHCVCMHIYLCVYTHTHTHTHTHTRIFCVRSSIAGQLDCVHILVIINSATMNIGVHVSFKKYIYIYIYIYFCLRWVFVAACGLSLVVASGGYSSLWCAGFSLRWLLLLQSMGSRCSGFSSCGTWAP